MHFYNSKDEQDQEIDINPKDLGITDASRAVDIPEKISRKNTIDKIETKVDASDIAMVSAKLGADALKVKMVQ